MDYQVWLITTTDSDNPAVCHDKIEHQPCAAWSGSPHDDESHLIFYPHVQLHHNYIIMISCMITVDDITELEWLAQNSLVSGRSGERQCLARG